MRTHSPTPAGRIARTLQRLTLASARPPLLGAWSHVYLAVAHVAAWALTRGVPHASVYLRGSVDSPDLLPGLSDVDLVVLLDPPRRQPDVARRIHERWERLRRVAPLVTRLVDRPRAQSIAELESLVGRSIYTFGLRAKPPDEAATAVGGTVALDRARVLERPGLVTSTGGWLLVTGRERRPPEAPRTAQDVRAAAWLELLFYWKRAYEVLVDPSPPYTAALCVKLVAEPARILLWLAERELTATRREALWQARMLLPGLEHAVDEVLALERNLRRLPDPPLDVVVPLLVGLTRAIATELDRQLAPAGQTHVRLVGTSPGRALPLCDWPALVTPASPSQTFSLAGRLDGAAALRTALAGTGDTRRIALGDGGLIAFPSARRRQASMRAVASPATDPVSFALVSGQASAGFPEVDGWSVRDWSRRAVAEHREALRDGRLGDVVALLGAARAALLRTSIDEDAPALPLTATATLEELSDRRAVSATLADAIAETVQGPVPPAGPVVAELNRAVASMDAYAR